MAKDNSTTRIDTITGRRKLTPRREPYWHKLATRQHLGFRKLADGSGRWIARYTTTDRKYEYQALGDDLDFDKASEKSRKHFKKIESGTDTRYTLQQAIDEYRDHLEIEKSGRTAKETRQRILKHTSASMLKVEVSALTTAQLKRWRDKMVKKSDDAEEVRKSKDTANRVLAMMKAALNLSFKSGIIGDDTAWRRLKTFRSVSAARILFLTDKQIKSLLEKNKGAIHNLLKAGILTGARYGELANAKVKDFIAKDGTLHLSGKTGARTVYLSDEAVTFFKELTKLKTPEAYILIKDDGTQWGESHQSRPVREAVRKTKLPSETVFYSLRHYHISKALLAGIPAQVVAENCGTSIRMLEKHYGKFMAADRRAMFNTVSLGGNMEVLG